METGVPRMLNYFCNSFFAILSRVYIIELLRVGAINYYMSIGHTPHEEYDNSSDTTPRLHYSVNVTQKDMDEIHHLVKRNYAGLTIPWLPAMIAVTKVLSQISKQDEELDNYDNDGVCPVCKAPEHEEID